MQVEGWGEERRRTRHRTIGSMKIDRVIDGDCVEAAELLITSGNCRCLQGQTREERVSNVRHKATLGQSQGFGPRSIGGSNLGSDPLFDQI